MHQALVGLPQLRGVLAHADLVGDDAAGVAGRGQEPGVIEAMFGSGCRARGVAVPADPRIGHEFVDLAFERQTERRPAEHGAMGERGAVDNPDIFRVGIPLGPLGRVDDV